MSEQLYDSNWGAYFTASGITPDKDPMSLRSVIKTIVANIGTGATGGLPLTGGTMSGNIAMGTHAITGVSDLNFTANAVTVTTNAGTVPVTSRVNNFTNSSSATMAITLATSGAVDGQLTMVRIYDFAATAETVGWTNTENSGVSAPTTSNGSTTLPLTVGFQYNGSTSKWRCIASA